MSDILFDQKAIDKVLNLDDEQLRKTISVLAGISGMNEKQAARLTKNTEMIRRKLAGMTEDDLRRMIAGIDTEKLKLAAEQLKNLQGM
ncbi:MAG: hypothetical protein MJ175_11450 [Clostridia bacterium]|nr:hypothetical protein [Clostridia bacterium]